jgi:DNA-binding transcriptional MerR regulator
MENLAIALEGTGLSDAEIERTMRKAQQSSERASAQAEAKMRRAQEKLERKMAAAQRKAELKAKAAERRRKGWRYEGVSSDISARDEPVSDDERLMILRMLEEKKISLEEAEKLLSAMESN